MSVSQAIRRYARAILDSATQPKQKEILFKDFQMIRSVLNGSPDLELFLKSPVIRQAQKKAVLKELFEKRVDTSTMNFLSLLSDKKRESLLGGIADSFIRQYRDSLGITEVRVTTTEKLSKAQEKNLSDELNRITGKQIELTAEIDSDLIGGMKVQIDDTVIDGSVKHKLFRLKEKYTSAAFE